MIVGSAQGGDLARTGFTGIDQIGAAPCKGWQPQLTGHVRAGKTVPECGNARCISYGEPLKAKTSRHRHAYELPASHKRSSYDAGPFRMTG